VFSRQFIIFIDENYKFHKLSREDREFIFTDVMKFKYAQNRSGWNLSARNIVEAWKGLSFFKKWHKTMGQPKVISRLISSFIRLVYKDVTKQRL
jgi:hypothetical protein